MGVIYKDIPGFPGYRVGDDGSVWSCRTPKSGLLRDRWTRLSPAVDKATGYPRLSLRREGKTYRKAVHCVVLETFVGPCPPGMEGCHFPDGSKTNNRLDNLRWDTRAANQEDSLKHGTRNRGSKRWKAKLSEADVLEIIEIRREIPNATMREIGILYGVTLMAISAIFTGDNWSWLTGIKPGSSSYGPNATRRRGRRLAQIQ